LELATEKKVVAQVAQDMYTLKEMLEHNNDFRSLMRSPVISFYKKDMIWKLLYKKMNLITQLFVSLLIRKGREKYLESIIASFIAQDKKINGIVDVTIYSTILLDKKVVDYIAKLVKKEIKAQDIEVINKKDPSLIGGFILQIKDQVIDLSIAKRLKDIEKQILA
ncbi:MAG: ATP synthase F1 subunit delta, partial [Chitinophagaceae bacterium]